MEENRAIRALFSQLRPILADTSLAAEVEDHIASTEEDIHISALQGVNDAMRTTLIRVHETIEAMEGAAARKGEAAIWAELRRSTERRRGPHDLFY